MLNINRLELSHMQLTPETLNLIVTHTINLLVAIVILIAGWVLAGWAGRQVHGRTQKTGKLDITLSIMLGKVTRATILVMTIIAVLNRFGVQTASLVALLGAAGLTIGLAMQGTLSNVASGVMLLIFRPFKVGDYIEYGGTGGIVDELGLFITRMHTPDNIAMYVPNSKIWGAEIKNFAVNDNRRMDLVFSISYSDDMDKALAIVNQLIATEPRFLKDPAPLVAVGELGESSVNLFVRPWVKRTEFLPTRLDFIKRVKERFDAEQITIPFPQRDIHIFNDSQPGETRGNNLGKVASI